MAEKLLIAVLTLVWVSASVHILFYLEEPTWKHQEETAK